MMNTVYLSLGSNIEPRTSFINRALLHLNATNDLELDAFSSFYASEPQDMDSESTFANMVVRGHTRYTSEQLLAFIAEIEAVLGRERDASGIPSDRTIDIDILYYDDEIIHTDTLIVPHPKIEQRLFVLEPLAEIAPDYMHPLLQKTSVQLRNECSAKPVHILNEVASL